MKIRNIITLFICLFMVACTGQQESQNTDSQLNEEDEIELQKIEVELDSLKKEEEILDDINQELEDILSDL